MVTPHTHHTHMHTHTLPYTCTSYTPTPHTVEDTWTEEEGKRAKGSGQVLERCSSNSTLNPSLEVTSPHELGGCGVCGGGRE